MADEGTRTLRNGVSEAGENVLPGSNPGGGKYQATEAGAPLEPASLTPDRGTSTLPRTRMNVLGLDLSSKHLDLVLVDENTDVATHTRVNLTGENAFERTRDVQDQMPPAGWYHDNGVYLVALERPFVRFGQDAIRLVQGAALACIPRELRVWEVTPSQWKKHVGIPIREKPTLLTFPAFRCAPYPELWPQDAWDALGVASYARDTNAKAIAGALERKKVA